MKRACKSSVAAAVSWLPGFIRSIVQANLRLVRSFDFVSSRPRYRHPSISAKLSTRFAALVSTPPSSSHPSLLASFVVFLCFSMNNEQMQGMLQALLQQQQQTQQQQQQLQEQIQQQQQFLQQYFEQQQEAAASSMPQSVASASNVTATSSEPLFAAAKPKPPPTFEGNRRDADTWLFQLDNYFDVVRMTDGQRVAYAGALLHHSAAQWWRRVKPTIHTWTAFRTAFIQQYQPLRADDTARLALYRLQQTKSVAAYIDAFTRYLNDVIDMSEKDQLLLFQQGLKPDIRNEVRIQHPKTLSEAMSWAQQADMAWQHDKRTAFRSSSMHRQPYSSIPASYRNSFRSMPADAPVPMELGSMEAELPAVREVADPLDTSVAVNAMQVHNQPQRTRHYAPTLSRQEFDRCRQLGICFRCKQPGHTARFCTNTQASNQTSKNEQSRQ